MGKVVVLGIDGAPWELVDRFIASGSLPNIQALIETGASGDLVSTIPPVTAPAWKCYSTGKNPGRLNAFWWTKFDFKEKRMTFNNSTDFRSKDYWDYASEAGEFCVQINMPMTYPPPPEFNGIFVSGVLALENDEYTTPKVLKEDLLRRHGWRITHESSYEVNPDKFIASVSELIDMRFDLAEEFVGRADLLHMTVFFIDDVQHFTWRQMKEGKGKYKDAIEDLWAQIDRRIGSLRRAAGEDHHFAIMSDHGFTDLKGTFYINEWLGPRYIKKKPVVKVGKKSLKERMLSAAEDLHLIPLFKRVLTERMRKRFQDKRRTAELGRREFFVWEETKVYGNTEGPLYINRDLVPNEGEYEALRDELIQELEGLIHPETGERAISKVYKREEVYTGPYMAEGPDMVALPTLGYEISGNIPDDGTIWTTRGSYHNDWTGIHRMEGIVILNGPDIKQGTRLEASSIYDLAPTILALKGLPIPNDMDGKVLLEAMREPGRFKDLKTVEGAVYEQAEHTFTPEEEEQLHDRLKSLGYM